MIPVTSAIPHNDYGQDDLDDEASEEEIVAPPRRPWRMILCLLAIPGILVLGMLWAIGAL